MGLGKKSADSSLVCWCSSCLFPWGLRSSDNFELGVSHRFPWISVGPGVNSAAQGFCFT